ncbi:acetate/propionate family kinase [Candidatus Poribacteria bacterium]|nr:acetate/propionate family kinase [Candidatus Poribacteria bacterium]MBT5536711.1 acetate/propionate family kinase [Candidatus Poribacteria bacterium]MBT5712930.1 acetate/propionate family kinase [Candidatus Poribacteria bacterium]
MRILVSNVGSSSYKFSLLDMAGEEVVASGRVERIGDSPSPYAFAVRDGKSGEGVLDAPDHLSAVEHVMAFLVGEMHGPPALEPLGALDGVGFKAVFAKGYTSSAIVDEAVMQGLEDYIPILPVHNPAYIASLRAFERLAPSAPRVAVFETWFHETIPPHAAELGVPRSWVRDHAIRRYGFHGASHRYVAQRTPTLLRDLGIERAAARDLRLVSCHLGGSSSLCAIQGGASIDTSMGFSAQSGVLQGTRCGDMDPFVPLYMMKAAALTLDEVEEALMSDAGLAGISGAGGDMRDINDAAEGGSADARLALDTYHYGVKKTIGGYAAALGGLDAIAFTGGIGERSAESRAAICAGMEFLGVRVDPDRNAGLEGEGQVSADDSPVPVVVVTANEEIVVARETARLIAVARGQA